MRSKLHPVTGHPVLGYTAGGKPIFPIGGGAETDFLDLVETLRSADASIDKLYGGEGIRIGRRSDPVWEKKVAEFTSIVVAARDGDHRAWFWLREAQSTSDFPNLFGDVLNRQLLGSYREITPTYPNYVRVTEVNDFRTVKRIAVDGAEGVLDRVGELAEYPEKALTDALYQYAVAKYGRRVGFSWEAFVNDDLGGFNSLPDRLARAARRTEERFATTLFVDTNGPHASLYTVGNANIVTANPALSIVALQTAVGILAAQTDADGEPIATETVHLVVPPALEIVALNILNATSIEFTDAGGTSTQKLVGQNWMKGRVKLHVNAYIPSVASTANGSRSWFLFASPTEGRPSLEMGFLRGNREPALFRKRSDQERIGGGASPEQGDFETDALAFKVRHVMGGTRMDPKGTVASNGSGV